MAFTAQSVKPATGPTDVTTQFNDVFRAVLSMYCVYMITFLLVDLYFNITSGYFLKSWIKRL